MKQTETPLSFSSKVGGSVLWRSLGSVLLCMVTYEAALLGSGRMLQVGPLTVKMILFIITLIYSGMSLLFLRRLRNTTILLTISFAVLYSLGLVQGIAFNANMKFMGEDASPLLAFLTLPFFELTIRNKSDIEKVIQIILNSAIVMAIGYALLAFLLWGHIVSFNALYVWINNVGPQDFAFEGNEGKVFYKGVLYMCIAVLFFLFRRKRLNKIVAIILFLAIFLVGMRGLFVALALTGLVYILIGPMHTIKKIGCCAVFLLLGAFAIKPMLSLFFDKTNADQDRLTNIHQVADSVNAKSAIIGHGFGIGVPIRPEHMELVYLEVFHKQGIAGLWWWTTLLVIMCSRLKKALHIGNRRLAYPLFLSAMFICFESLFDPFINNPIGMYACIISFVSLAVLARPDTSSQRSNSGQPQMIVY